jgi:hypothetical protein
MKKEIIDHRFDGVDPDDDLKELAKMIEEEIWHYCGQVEDLVKRKVKMTKKNMGIEVIFPIPFYTFSFFSLNRVE